MIMRVHSRKLPAMLAVAALSVACAACQSSAASSGQPASPAAGFPVTIGSVHLKARPGAIVSLSPTATEMLYAIGAGHEVKAVDSDSDYPAGAPVTKLSAYQPNAEAIANYKPDLVIISNDMDGITAKLTSLGIPVLDLPAALTVSDVYSEITELGRATGQQARAATEDSTLKSDIAAIVAAEPAHASPLTYYYELSSDPYY